MADLFVKSPLSDEDKHFVGAEIEVLACHLQHAVDHLHPNGFFRVMLTHL